MSAVREATPDELERWNELVTEHPFGVGVWSSLQYARVKEFNGYRARFLVSDDGQIPATLVLEKTVWMLGKLWYLPAGPAGANVSEVLAAAQRIADYARTQGVFALKIEPQLLDDPDTRKAIAAAGFVPTFRIIPNESSVVLDLTGTEEETSARFASSCRNKIRRAEKEGLEVRQVEATDENCRIMFDLLEQTSAGRFELRPFEYYRLFWQSYVKSGDGVLLFGEHDGRVVAGLFGMALGGFSVYKDGASVRENLPTGAMNALQWELIRWARERGVHTHDLCGAPHSSRVDDRSHPLYGVGQYKLAFNKEIIDHVGTFDLALRPMSYRIWHAVGDRLARRIALAKRHDPYY